MVTHLDNRSRGMGSILLIGTFILFDFGGIIDFLICSQVNRLREKVMFCTCTHLSDDQGKGTNKDGVVVFGVIWI